MVDTKNRRVLADSVQKPSMHVLCVGHLNWDIRFRVDRLPTPDDEGRVKRRHESGGGSAANVAVGLARLDRETHFLGSVGDDDRGTNAIVRLEDAGVEPHVRTTTGQTAVKYILVDDAGEVALFGTEGANESFRIEDLPSGVLAGSGALHLTAQPPETAEALARQAPDDALVSFDPGRRSGDRNYASVFEHVDLLFATTRERRTLDVDVPVMVTKRGRDGAAYTGPDGTFEHPGFDIGEAVDTTGAGDAFAAGFLAVWLDDADPERALTTANACGALAASREGPGADLSWERIEMLLDREPD